MKKMLFWKSSYLRPGSVGKGTCCQAWWPQLNAWDTHGSMGEQNFSSNVEAELICVAVMVIVNVRCVYVH